MWIWPYLVYIFASLERREVGPILGRTGRSTPAVGSADWCHSQSKELGQLRDHNEFQSCLKTESIIWPTAIHGGLEIACLFSLLPGIGDTFVFSRCLVLPPRGSITFGRSIIQIQHQMMTRVSLHIFAVTIWDAYRMNGTIAYGNHRQWVNC
jgi:hypothetical protein